MTTGKLSLGWPRRRRCTPRESDSRFPHMLPPDRPGETADYSWHGKTDLQPTETPRRKAGKHGGWFSHGQGIFLSIRGHISYVTLTIDSSQLRYCEPKPALPVVNNSMKMHFSILIKKPSHHTLQVIALECPSGPCQFSWLTGMREMPLKELLFVFSRSTNAFMA